MEKKSAPKKFNLDSTLYQYGAVVQSAAKESYEYENLKKRVEQFKTAGTIEEAKELSKKILPVSGDFTSFYVGNALCSVVNTETCFRVTLETDKELISYDFE